MGARASERRIELVKALRDAVDSLKTWVESGCGFDYALFLYTEKSDDELARAFEGVLQEMKTGVLRKDALANMAERIAVPEVTAFSNAMIKCEQQGTSELEALKIQAKQLHQ